MISLRYFLTLTFLTILLLHNSCLNAQEHTVYLIGDAGEDKVPGKTLCKLKEFIDSDSNSTVLFLGDNAYPKGLVSKKICDTTLTPFLLPDAANLYAQLQILNKYKGNVFFVAGNHDWKAQKRAGAFQTIMNQSITTEKYLNDSSQIKNKELLNFVYQEPTKKYSSICFDVNESLSILLFDSQYFFQKISRTSKKQKLKQLDGLLHELDSIISIKESEGKKVVIASHHPLFTAGNHSKARQPLRFLINWTPLQVFGWLGLNRWLMQDIGQPYYKKYKTGFQKLLNGHKNIILAAGHDHNLQLIKDHENNFIVSGSGSKIKSLNRNKINKTVFSDDKHEGFARLICKEDKSITLEFISDIGDILYSETLIK